MVKVFAISLLGMKLALLMIAGMIVFSYLSDFSYFSTANITDVSGSYHYKNKLEHYIKVLNKEFIYHI
jgi:hypothetical protein